MTFDDDAMAWLLDAQRQEAERLIPFLEDIAREQAEIAAILDDIAQAELEHIRLFLEDIGRQDIQAAALLNSTHATHKKPPAG